MATRLECIEVHSGDRRRGQVDATGADIFFQWWKTEVAE